MVVLTRVAGGADAGDANCDGAVDEADLAAVVTTIFEADRSDCAAADVNGDEQVSSADVVALTNLLTAALPTGPSITFIGLAGADGTPASPLGRIGTTPVYFRTSSFGFKLVIEGAAGLSGLTPGLATFNTASNDSARRPDVQIESSNPLGDASAAVCEGGVPAVNPPNFGPTQAIANALNDLGCNFAAVTSARFACTQDAFGTGTFLGDGTQAQFCLQVPRTLELPSGETLFTVRLRDTAGSLGPPQQLMVRIGPGPVPPTFTAQPTFTSRPTPTPTPTHTATSTPTHTPTPTPSLTRTATRTPTRTPTVASPSPTATPRPTSAMPSPTVTRTPTRRTGTPTVTLTTSPTRTRTRTPTRTRTRTPTVTATQTPARGPAVSFFGLTRSDDSLIPQSGTTTDGLPIFSNLTRTGFSIVVEGRPGTSGADVGHSAFQGDRTSFPDLQVQVSRPLGNGSPAVCDNSGATVGGVPGIAPPSFEPTQTNIDIVNDLGCRFVDGNGVPVGRKESEACVTFQTGEQGFVNVDSTIQFCGLMTAALQLPPGDTTVTVRLRDIDGNVGPIAQLVVRVGAPEDTPTPTPTETATPPSPTPSSTSTRTRTATATRTGPTSTRTPTGTPTRTRTVGSPTTTPTRTRTATSTRTRTVTRTRTPTPTLTPTVPPPSGPVITFLGLTRSDDVLIPPSGMTPDGVPIYSRLVSTAFSIVVEGMPGASGLRVGESAYRPDGTAFPDLQVEVSRALGNGSPAVCDSTGPMAGGVPAIDPPSFEALPTNIAAVNDFGCRFVDGSGKPGPRRNSDDSCVMFASGDSGFVGENTMIQFCGFITGVMDFPPGDTVVTARLRDEGGNPGPIAQLVVRVAQ